MTANRPGRLKAWFRGMIRGDLRDILRVEAQAFEFPWSEEDFVEHLKEPDSVALVVECDAGICGYLVFGFDHEWIRLYSCVVADRYRDQGIGTAMMARLCTMSATQRRSGILAKVPERNVAAQLFFRSCGFRAIEILRDYFLDGQDLYLMRYVVPGATIDAGAVPNDQLIPMWEVKHV